MERKNLILLLAAAGLILLSLSAIMIAAAVQFVGGREVPTPVTANNVTLCDMDASGLCVVSFGADNLNRMVINFQLPRAKYPAFYARVEYRETSAAYSCQVVKEVPKSAYCTGPRTPLGEPIVIRIFRAKDDRLLAEGNFVVSAIALPTLPSPNLAVEAADITPSPLLTSPEGTVSAPPNPPRFGPTPTPPPGYPNP